MPGRLQVLRALGAVSKAVTACSLALFASTSISTTAAEGQEPYDYAANCRAWPTVSGPHGVGTIELELSDTMRSAQYAPTPTPARRLYVRAWYPATSVQGIPPRPYFTSAEATVLPAVLLQAAQQPPDALRECAALATNSHQGAPPASGRFPVVAFNHGYTSYPAQQTALFEHLAANGYVVLTVGHPFESGAVVFENGDVLRLSPRILGDLAGFATLTSGLVSHFGARVADRVPATIEYIRQLRKGSLGQLAPVWQSDVYFVLDRFEDLDVPANARPLAGAIDHGRRAYMGMSYGGYIAGMLAQGDGRARAAVNLDGGNWTYELIDTDLRTPFLMLNSDLVQQVTSMAAQAGASGIYSGPLDPKAPTSGDLAYERLTTAGSRDDVYRFVVPGIQHLGVSDLPEILTAPAARPALGQATILGRLTALQNEMVRGFLDRYVKGEPNGYPAALLRAYPELIVRDRADIRRQALELQR